MPDAQSARIAFAGTPEFARIILAGLLAAGVRPILVLSQPDRPAGRGRRLRSSPVAQLASERSLLLQQPEKLRTAAQIDPLIAAAPDLLIVAAYGLILPPDVLAIPRLGCVNVHASLLPRWRGAAPVERAMLAGDRATGVSLMQMDAGLDTGPVLDRAVLAIDATETGESLERRLAQLGSDRLLACLPALLRGALIAEPQDGSASTYAPKLRRADASFDWAEPALDIAHRVNALSGRRSVETKLEGTRIHLLAATSCADTSAALRSSDVAPGVVKSPGTILTTAPALIVQCGDGCLQIHRLRFIDRGKGAALDARAAVNGYSEILRPGVRFDASA